jgi:hypothetical protein
MRAVRAVLLPLLVVAACSAPPQKEIDMAQGAIDAARAAGAEQYATEEYAAATAALQDAHDAVGQRDFRLALTRALDAHDRAQDAARGAADGKARARGEVEAATAAAAAAVAQIQRRIEAAETAKVPARELASARKAHADAGKAVQEARTAIAAEEFGKAHDAVRDVPAMISAEITAIEAAITKRAPRRGR